jgi:hypothetical protein
MAMVALGAGLLFTSIHPANALPQFANRYDLPCSTCHTMIPRLTPYGYQFQRAGYRLPNTEEKAATILNTASFLTTMSFRDTSPGGDTGFNVDGEEVQVAAPIDKHLTTRIMYEFSSQTEASSGFAEAWGQYNTRSDDNFFTFKAGQIPVLSGFKLTGDRSFTLTDAMLFSNMGPLGGANQGNFSLAGLERGIEMGYTHGGLTGKFSWLNGVNSLGQGDVTLTGHRAQDYALQADWLIGNEGSSISAFYYHGQTPFATVFDANNNVLLAGYNDQFYRAGIFGSFDMPLIKESEGHKKLLLELNGGAVWGRDRVDINDSHANSYGSILESDLYYGKTALAFRFDNVKPSDQLDSPLNATTEAYTLCLANQPSNFARIALEYRHQIRPGGTSLMGGLWLFY